MDWIWFVLWGILAGIYGGFLGLGAGTILVPILLYIFHLTQYQAQGTALAAMVLPVTFLAALRYYQNGNAKLSIAFFLAIGIFFGSFIGAHIAQQVPEIALRRMFGCVILLIAIKMIIGK